MEQASELIKAIQQGLLRWYTFVPGSTALYIGDSGDALAELLLELELQVICVGCDYDGLGEYPDSFDYIISITDLEKQPDPHETLRAWRKLLKPEGRLLLGMNNRLGLRHFCGDRDPYTGRNFDGIENYRRAYVQKGDVFRGRCYSQAELKDLLLETGWKYFRFFSVLPDLWDPCLLYAEDYLPNEDLSIRLFPAYNHPDTVFLEEEHLYSGLIANGMFHQMANAYLIECSPCGALSDVQHVTNSTERGREDAFMTMIRRSGIVEKRAVYPEGQARLESLIEHNRDLAAHGISVVEARLENGVYTMPYIEAEVGQVYLQRLLQTDGEKFLEELDHFRDLILQSSEIVKPDTGDGQGAILRWGYFDLVPLNSFYQNGTFTFYDQEFCIENYPANVILYRVIAGCYSENTQFKAAFSRNDLFDRYGLTAELERWRKMEREFLTSLRKEKELHGYHEGRRRSVERLHENRQRINYTDAEYRRLFVDIFPKSDAQRLILFGSGAFAKRFMTLYGPDCPVYGIVDNNEARWGQTLEGVPICSPELLREMKSGKYKVLICIRDYLSVARQLDAIGVTEYSVYDSGKVYDCRRKLEKIPENEEESTKKYHVGYIAGVFDLFHIGHLNMFRRAKEQCDYLIVGVVADEGVRDLKKNPPFVPFAERIELVRACRYVDEAVEIPLNYGGTRDAYRMYRFDCQFSGSDYIDDPYWLSEKRFLEQQGSEMVFFPYTESTSSTKLKALIEEKLL